MCDIMNSPKGVQSDVPERVSIFCPKYGTLNYLHKITGNQSYVIVIIVFIGFRL